jgi:hypothetical protein
MGGSGLLSRKLIPNPCFTLICPDQIVAWRGNSSADAAAVLRQARRATAESDITSSSNQRT